MREDLMAAALRAAATHLWANVEYTPSGGTSRTVKAWISASVEDAEEFGQTMRRDTHKARLIKADVADLSAGATLVSGGVTYVVLPDIRPVEESPLEWDVPLKVQA